MKYLRFVLVVFASAVGVAYAQDEERRAPPTEIPDFSNLDEYIYEPKSTVTLGFRYLSGAKTTFGGTGRISSPDANAGPATGANLNRVYHDGSVRTDGRFTPRLDDSGNPIRDPNGNQLFDPIAADGKTNTWNYIDNRQLVRIDGDSYMAFHTYSADIVDSAKLEQKALSTAGLDLAVSRDMGKLWGSKLAWTLTAGMSVNDIAANTNGGVRADLNALTDYYSLFGRTPPAAPYSAPSSATATVVDANGNAVTDQNGNTQTVVTDTTILLGNLPLGRTTTITTDATSVTNRWKLKGAYYTFRAGPTLWIPITGRFRASVSLGAAFVYSGTDYTVTESFQPEIGNEISETEFSHEDKILPGFYVDASLQFDLTERTGFYAGAVFQSTGSYDQKLESASSAYTTKVDLANQNGLRAGMTIRF